MDKYDDSENFDLICANCGCTLGSHHAKGIGNYPHNYCPNTESGMDWANSPGTYFKNSGKRKEDI